MVSVHTGTLSDDSIHLIECHFEGGANVQIQNQMDDSVLTCTLYMHAFPGSYLSVHIFVHKELRGSNPNVKAH